MSLMCNNLCEDTQCCALSHNNKRCTNQTINSQKLHCKDHYDKAVVLYNQYKKVCDLAYKMDINKEKSMNNINEKINYLNLCYRWYIKAYEARLKHRDYAFTPENQDFGHNLQFKIIQDKIDACEKRLAELYHEHTSTKSHQSTFKETLESNEIESTNMNGLELEDETETEMTSGSEKPANQKLDQAFNQVNKFKLKRANDEKETNALIQTYMLENTQVYEEMSKLVKLAAKTMTTLYVPTETTDAVDVFYTYVGIFHLVRELYGIGYLTPDYKPVVCTDCKCGSILPYDIKLSCTCVFLYTQNNPNPSIEKYLYSMNKGSLKTLCQLIFAHGSKIKPLVEDFIYYYRIYDQTILTTEIELFWDLKNKRLKIGTESVKTEKRSKHMATFRRSKRQLKKMKEEMDSASELDSEDEELHGAIEDKDKPKKIKQTSRRGVLLTA
jgi:hypothetical protein